MKLPSSPYGVAVHDGDQPQVQPGQHWNNRFTARVRAARVMLLAGCTEEEVRGVHGLIVLREARKAAPLRKPE